MAMPRRFTRKDNWEFGGQPAHSEGESGEARPRKRRLATTLVFTTLFFAGASFAAFAGDQLSPLLSSDGPYGAAPTDATTSTDAEAAAAAPAEDSTTAAPATDPAAGAPAAPDAAASADPASTAPAATDAAAAPADATTDPNAEDAAPASATDYGSAGPATTNAAAPASRHTTRSAGKDARHWKRVTLRSILLPKRKPAPAPEIEGPADAATIWLNSQLPDPTATRLLSDPMVSIYEGGRNDIVQDKVDVRVLAVIAYLRETFGQVTVSSLISGHRLYARPGVISAHIAGHAVDIAGLANTPIQGHQEPGGMTERAVRAILFLPTEVMPRQVISLLGLGGPSFPLADHYNHIHIGF